MSYCHHYKANGLRQRVVRSYVMVRLKHSQCIVTFSWSITKTIKTGQFHNLRTWGYSKQFYRHRPNNEGLGGGRRRWWRCRRNGCHSTACWWSVVNDGGCCGSVGRRSNCSDDVGGLSRGGCVSGSHVVVEVVVFLVIVMAVVVVMTCNLLFDFVL